jgi:hypothetical protein
MDFAGTVSMFINRCSVQKYLAAIEGHWARGTPIDLHLRQEIHAGRLKAYVTAPFVTSITAANSVSDIRGTQDFARDVFDVYRRAFYLYADQDALLAQLKQATRGAKTSTLASIYLHAQLAALSDRWTTF